MTLLCYLIHTLCSQFSCNSVPLSLFPSVQPVALVGGEGLLKCQGPGVYGSFAVCLPHRSQIVIRRAHFSCTFDFSLLKTSNYVPLIIHASIYKPGAGSVPPLRAPRRGHKPSLSFPLVVKALEGIISFLHFSFLPPLVRLKFFTGLQRLTCWLDSRAELRKAERGGAGDELKKKRPKQMRGMERRRREEKPALGIVLAL